MKKKTLFSLALASILMVGCQQDEFVSMNEDTSVNLGNRPELGQVSLNWGIPTTRMALNTMNNYSFVWEEDDRLGAAIVDQLEADVLNGTEKVKGNADFNGEDYSTLEWTYQEYVTDATKDFTNKAGKKVKVTAKETGIDVSEFYTVVDYISSNYPYVRNAEGAWTTQANLVEGNYVFYAPYNQAHLTRQPIVVTLPMEQDCTEESKALKDFYKGTDPVALGVDFLSAPDNKEDVIYPSVKMANIFAYPQITIKNDFNGYLFKGDAVDKGKFYSSAAADKYTMKLKKVEIYTTTATAPLNYKSALDANAFKAQVAYGWDNDVNKFTTGETSKILNATSTYSVEDYPAYPADQTTAKADAGYATQYANSSDDLISDYQVKHITCDLGGKELKNGEEYKFFAIMPAEDYGKGLFAKVFVEIDGESYIILTSATDLNVVDDADADNNGYAYFTDATKALADYNFSDPKHGDEGVRLVRGQRFPAAEVLEDASAVKDFAGSLMTINLVGGKTQAAYAMAKEIKTESKGIVDNADFIDHITRKVQRGTNLIENTVVGTKDRSEWAAKDIAFAPDNKVVINAELIKALYNRLYDKRPDGVAATGDVLTLKATKLPIANDVVVTLKAGTTYTFTTSDKVSYDIDFGSLVNTTGTALVNGINTVSAAGELKAAKDVTGAVVFVSGAITATLNDATGITGIDVASDATLTVNCSTDALIMSKGTITIGGKGALNNANNVLEGTISNDFLKAIVGNAEKATVSASMIGWPTTTIPATAKVNALTINLGVEGALTISKAEVDKLANLSDVVITLGDNVNSIKSSTSVTLTNIKSMKSNTSETDIKWITTSNAITIYCGVDDPAANFFTKIAAANGVTFAK